LADCAGHHAVQNTLEVLRAIGAKAANASLELWLSSEDHAFAAKHLAATEGEVLLGIAPGAREKKRTWPLGNFVEVARWFQEQCHARIVVVGGPAEQTIGETIASQLGPVVVNLANRATLRQSAAVLSRCAVLVGNDSAPIHLAAAMQVPVVEVSCHPRSASRAHYNSPAWFGPWGVKSAVLQPAQPLSPCNDGCVAQNAHCITQICIEEVKTAITRLLDENITNVQPATACHVQ
jgi:ADP-heptose:LPS heptosyltransferase